MTAPKRIVPAILAALLALAAATVFVLGLHRPVDFIRNFEDEEFSETNPFLEPVSNEGGLAVYAVGEGPPVLLLPYPHGHTIEPMAQGPLADLLVGLGHSVITFDVPGAYRSTREPVGDMAEMIGAADEALDRLGIDGPIDVMGHSMSGFVALAYAIERPSRVRRLVLANSVAGFPSAARCGFPGSAFRPTDREYWQIILWGVRINGGRADLALHKRLFNLMGRAAYYEPSLFSPLEIEEDDKHQGVPIRMIWSRNMYRGLSYSDRLHQVEAPTLVLASRHDPEAGLACSVELAEAISNSRLIIFEESGHAPFVEEPERVARVLAAFLEDPSEDP